MYFTLCCRGNNDKFYRRGSDVGEAGGNNIPAFTAFPFDKISATTHNTATAI